MSINYEIAGRVGLILPSVNTTAEIEIRALLPSSVSLHVTRIKLTGSTAADFEAMAAGASKAAQLLADARVDLIVFHCTAASTWSPKIDEKIRNDIKVSCGINAVTTGGSLLSALAALKAESVSLVSPYTSEVNDRESQFLSAHGFEVVSKYGLGLTDPHEMSAVEPQTWIELAATFVDQDADACFISCAAIRVCDVISNVEAVIKIPVVTSNQVVVWDILRHVLPTHKTSSYGRLLAS